MVYRVCCKPTRPGLPRELTPATRPCYREELFWPQSTHWVPELLWRERLGIMGLTKLVVRGARQHNLKNISVEIPRNSLTVITGLSGSGKSSLAFDTIYAEGQRRYVESLSAYARQFLDQMERPEVDVIEGLSPSIAIEQKTTTRSPRSTVGTITEIYDYLRVIYASVGVPHCPNCGKPITRQSSEQIVQSILHGELCKPDDRIMILAPIVRGRKGAYRQELEKFAQDGYVRVRINGELFPLDDLPVIDKRKNHTIEIVIDRLLVKPGIAARLEQSIATALKLAAGLVTVAIVGGKEHTFSEKRACPDCGISVPVLEPRSFSFNSPYGACPACNGLGSKYDFTPSKIIHDWSRPLFDGGLGPGSASAILKRTLELAAYAHGFDLETPFDKFPARIQNMLLYGYPPSNGRGAAGENGAATKKSKAEKGFRFPGILKFLERNFEESGSDTYREWMTQYMSATLCSICHGKRLRPESLAVKLGGWSIADFTALSLSSARPAVDKILAQLTERQKEIAARPLEEVAERVDFLLAVGLGYLSLDRSAATLSGGEAQRIRLATQIGSLEHLRNLGNTVLVVEHDEDTIRRADFVVDLGPGAGNAGGYLVAQGKPAQIEATAESLTGQYLSGAARISIPEKRRSPNGKAIQILGASANNLKDVDITLPLGLLTVVTGVSGSGKSTLVNDILYRALAQQLYRSQEPPGAHREIVGGEQIDKVIEIDQAPIGRTPRSNPATYTGVFAPIRELFAMLPESRERGYRPGRFSFNVKGGRCEACQGDGLRRIEMNFLPDVYVMCEVCRGRRYNSETLAVRYKGHSISDVLDLPSSDALKLLENIPQIQQKLATFVEVGLAYVTLGQSATTLSGGEAQRIKLARELSKRQTGRTLYILDEPTTGLHFDDVRKLLDVLQRLVDLGNTVLIIEHHLDVIKQADWINEAL